MVGNAGVLIAIGRRVKPLSPIVRNRRIEKLDGCFRWHVNQNRSPVVGRYHRNEVIESGFAWLVRASASNFLALAAGSHDPSRL